MPAYDLRIRPHIKAEPTLEPVDDMPIEYMDEDEKKMLFNEINNLKDLDHPNILKMYEFFEDEKRYYIVTDICKGGELFDEIVARGKFSEQDASMLMTTCLGRIWQ